MYCKYLFIFLLIFGYQINSQSQAKLDIELLAGTTINGSKYDFSNDRYEFKLRDGFSRGIGFDIWFNNDYSISFGFNHSNSKTRSSFYYTNNSEMSTMSGNLIDRIIYLGTKKRLNIGKKTAIIPFLGIIANAYSYDSKDIERKTTVQNTNFEEEELETFSYVRFNNSNPLFYGSFGTKFGTSLEQNLGNWGKVSLNISYSLATLKDVEHSKDTYINEISTDPTTNISTLNTQYQLNKRQQFRRNLLQIEVGFKMPCSIRSNK